MNIYDQAVLDFANDQLDDRGYPRDAVALEFGYELGCYSSWTCDYYVTATVRREDGSTVRTAVYWNDAIEALPEYVSAREAMEEEHERSHGRDDE